jgi:phage recombination protein Bet
MSAAQEVIPAAEVRAQEQERVSLLATFAHRYGLEPNNMMRTLRGTVLRPSNNGAEPSNEQVAAFMIVANQHQLNPFTKEIHGFVDKRGGIVPIVGVDGWAKLANQHPQYDGIDFQQDDEKCTCTVYRKDRAHPTVVTEYLSECKQASPAWSSHPKRMLRHRAMVQAYRLAFSFAGVYDPDEGEQVLAAQNAEIDVTPTGELLDVPEGTKAKRIGYGKLREVVEAITKATENGDGPGLLKVWDQYDNEQKLFIWGSLRSWERSAFKKLETEARKAVGTGDLPGWSIELLKSCKNAVALEDAWKSIQEAFAEADQEIPDNVATTCDEMRSSMGTV